MMLKTCEIRECGARVMVVNVHGQPFAVNPRKVELLVEDDAGGFRLVRGFEPHNATCVNIGDRLPRRDSRGR